MPRRPRDFALNRDFGDKVRALRADAGLTQERLSELAGIHRTYVGHIERGAVTPTLDTIVRLAEAMGHDPADLVSGLNGAES